MQKSMVVGIFNSTKGCMCIPDVFVSEPSVFVLQARPCHDFWCRPKGGESTFKFILTWDNNKIGNNFAVTKVGTKIVKVVGQVPRNFGDIWKEWVHDPLIQDSALHYLSHFNPKLSDILKRALDEKCDKKINNWFLLSRLMLPLGKRERFDQKLLTATRVTELTLAACPIRLASLLGWDPPIPRPGWFPQPTMTKLELSL